MLGAHCEHPIDFGCLWEAARCGDKYFDLSMLVTRDNDLNFSAG